MVQLEDRKAEEADRPADRRPDGDPCAALQRLDTQDRARRTDADAAPVGARPGVEGGSARVVAQDEATGVRDREVGVLTRQQDAPQGARGCPEVGSVVVEGENLGVGQAAQGGTVRAVLAHAATVSEAAAVEQERAVSRPHGHIGRDSRHGC